MSLLLQCTFKGLQSLTVLTMAELRDYALPFLIFIASMLAKARTRCCFPPSPRALPIIGHMHLLGAIRHQAFHELSNHYGPLVYFFIGSKPCVLASTPEMAKDILKNNESNFMNRPKVANLDYLPYGSAVFATIPYGPHWKFMKKLCMTELLGSQTLNQFLPIRQEETKQFLKVVLSKAEAKEAVSSGGELMRLTNNIISRMVLRMRCSDKEDEADEVRKLVKELNDLDAKFNFSDTMWFCKNLDLQGFEKRLKDAPDRYEDMMERIIKDTSSITVEWILAELINHPHVMEKARQKIDSSGKE